MEPTILIAVILGPICGTIFIIHILVSYCNIRYRKHPPRPPKEIFANADAYRRYKRYTLGIAVWAILVSVYIIILEHTVQSNEFLGSRGSPSRERNFQILSFFRTGFAVVHVPIMTAVLAATIPYW